MMEKIKVKTGHTYFGIVDTLNGTYVCPGWIPVPHGTTRETIELDMSDISIPKRRSASVKKGPSKEWRVESSKPGKFYTVSFDGEKWDCNCPAKMFHRGDCKHIKAKKV